MEHDMNDIVKSVIEQSIALVKNSFNADEKIANILSEMQYLCLKVC